MGTNVGRQTDIQEEQMTDRRSLSSNNRYCSQSTKMSVGILVNSISNAKTKDLQEPGAQTVEVGSSSKKNSVRCREGHSPLMEKHVIVEPKNASPWVSTRSFNPKISSSVADKDTERTPSFPATRRTRPTSKILEKASAAHSIKYFAAKSGLGSDVCRQKNSGRENCSVENGNVDTVEHVENLVYSTEQGVQQAKEQVQDKDRKKETGGRESLRIKLWEILGDVSSPNKQPPSLQCEELHLDQEKNRKQSPIRKLNINSDTIESDSQTQISTRPITRSLARMKAARKQGSKTEATNSINRKDCQRNRIFSSKGDLSVGSYGNFVDGSLPSKGEKVIMGMSSRAETNQGVREKDVEERQQSEKSRSIPVEKSMLQKNKVSNASSSTDRRNDVNVEPEKGTKNSSSFEFSLNAMTDRRDVQNSMVVEASKKNLQEDISDSLFKRKRNSLHPQKGIKNNSPFKIPNDQMDVQKSMDVEASKKDLEEDISDSLSKRKRNSVQPKRVTVNNSSFEFPLNARTDQRDVEQSMDVEALKKNLQEDISDYLIIKKRNTMQPKKDTKNNSSFEFPLHAMTDQRDADVKASKKNLKEDISDHPLKKKRNTVHDPSSPPSDIKSRSSLQKSNQEELHDQIPAEKVFNRTGIQSFKSFLSSKSANCGLDVQQEISVGRNKQKNSPKRSIFVKPNMVMDEDSDIQSKSLTDETNSESSEDGSHCKEPEELSPEIRISEKILHNSDKSLDNEKDVGVVGSSPASDSSKGGVQDTSELEMYMEENQEDGLTRAVALFTVALGHVKTKLKSISSRRSADILRTAVEEILLRLQNAESLVKTDVGKLTNLSHSKSKQLETRFQEKQDQLLEIHKRFKIEVTQHLQNCGSLIEDLEEHEIELKRSVEKQGAAHKKLVSQVEQEINAQLEDAESRIMAVQEMARGKMLQLKLAVAECLKHGGLS
ncbi:thyroid receptor-interacting protein 11-like [Salvia hispanica]|uniref:thyroid receptor-interacting protein 11-like n=1 Tax=Salvia hispanica TaxID=49212 RepID=UPI0020093310|nr:thyroid receptor-interacting protein 11-like [Salvia hispanica]